MDELKRLIGDYPERNGDHVFPLLSEILQLSKSLPVDHESMRHLVENLSASVQLLRGEPNNTSTGTSSSGTCSSTNIMPSSVPNSLPSSMHTEPTPSTSRSLPTSSRRRARDEAEEGSSGRSNRPKRHRIRNESDGSGIVWNVGGRSTRTRRSVSNATTDICSVKNVSIPLIKLRPECPDEISYLLMRVGQCDSTNTDIPEALGVTHDLPAVGNPTDVTAAKGELDRLYNAASSNILQYSMLKNQSEVQLQYGIGRVVNEFIAKSADLHGFINRANYGEAYQPHPTDPNLLQLISNPRSVVSIAEGDVSIVDKLAEHCMKLRKKEIISSLEQCVTPNCQSCHMLKRRWESTGEFRFSTGDTCQSGKVAMEAASMKYKNTSKSSLHECLLFARVCPPHTKLARGLSGIPATTTVTSLANACRFGTPSDRMYLCRDLEFVIDGGNDALSAIHFVDGDSGFIVIDRFAELQKYSQYGSRVHFTNGVSETWIPFREAYHDAVELSHQFVVSELPSGRRRIVHDLGSVGHWTAMATLHSAKKVYVNVVDDRSVHQPNGRLIVSVIVQRQDDVWEPLALEVIRNGVSFLTVEGRKQAPKQYKIAEVFAEENGKGLYAIPKHLLEVTDEPRDKKNRREMCGLTRCTKESHGTVCRFADCMPWKIRNLGLNFNQKKVIVHAEDKQLHVTRSRANIHQSMLFVAKSTIPNAGYGLFLRPHSTGMYFSANETLCLYSREVLTKRQTEQLSTQDYVLALDGSRYVDASVFCGWNLGRFANQGGLLEGLKQLAADFSVDNFQPSSANKVVDSFCNVKFSRNTGSVVAIKVNGSVLQCDTNNTAKELFADYGLTDYWIRYLSELDSVELDPNTSDELYLLVRWLVATSKRSRTFDLGHTSMYSNAQVDWLVRTCPVDCPVQFT